jgi:predicted peptidase
MGPRMTAARTLLPALVVLLTASGCGGPATGFITRTYKGAGGQKARFALFVPHDYSPQRPVPVILFLHGGGEAGTDGWKPTQVGIGPAIRAREQTFPFLVVFPQAQLSAVWLPGQAEGNRAMAILDEVRKEYRTDPKRVYLTGVSMGGFGVWQFSTAFPERWAAIVPICGLDHPAKVEVVKDIPCWCFHDEQDGVVSVQTSRDMVDVLRKAGGQPRYTEYPGVGHNSWDAAYATDELYDWLLQQHR